MASRPALGLALAALLLVAAGGGLPPLVDAARNGDLNALRALLKQGASVNAAEADGTTALHWASYRDDVDSADALIRAGARVNAANDLGVTPLWTASQNGSPAMVERLLQAGANVNKPLLAGETPLMVAARSGHAEVAGQLIARGANVNARATRGQTALMWAVSQQHSPVVKRLLAAGADVHARSDTWSDVMAVSPHGYLDYNKAIPHGRDTAILFAARVGDLESAKLLVAAGANVDDADAWGVSATAFATHSGFGELVTFLLEQGADPNADGAGFTALHEAIMRRDEPLVRTLLEYGADPNATLRTWTPTRRQSRDFNFEPELVGATPFWLAARVTHPAVMRMLVTYGADPLVVHQSDKVVDGRGGKAYEHRYEATTALMAAVGMGGRATAWMPPERGEREALALETAKVAVELGVNVNAVNTDGRTALDAAKGLKYETVAAFLVSKGAKAGTSKADQTPTPR